MSLNGSAGQAVGLPEYHYTQVRLHPSALGCLCITDRRKASSWYAAVYVASSEVCYCKRLARTRQVPVSVFDALIRSVTLCVRCVGYSPSNGCLMPVACMGPKTAGRYCEKVACSDLSSLVGLRVWTIEEVECETHPCKASQQRTGPHSVFLFCCLSFAEERSDGDSEHQSGHSPALRSRREMPSACPWCYSVAGLWSSWTSAGRFWAAGAGRAANGN